MRKAATEEVSRTPVMLGPRGQTGQNFGLGLDKLASASSVCPRSGLGISNLASKIVLSNAYRLYPFRGCIIATFITKTYSDVEQYMLFALSPCVLIQKYLHVATLSLPRRLGLDLFVILLLYK